MNMCYMANPHSKKSALYHWIIGGSESLVLAFPSFQHGEHITSLALHAGAFSVPLNEADWVPILDALSNLSALMLGDELVAVHLPCTMRNSGDVQGTRACTYN